MRSLDANSFHESSLLSTEAVVPELHHGHGQVLRLVEGGSTSIDIDHKLLPGWSDRRVETFPCLETPTKTHRPHSARSEEESVAADHHTLSGGAVRKRGENQVKRGDDWQNLVSLVLPGEKP